MKNNSIDQTINSWDELSQKKAQPSDELDNRLYQIPEKDHKPKYGTYLQWAAVIIILILNFATWFSQSKSESEDLFLLEKTYTLTTFDTQNFLYHEE